MCINLPRFCWYVIFLFFGKLPQGFYTWIDVLKHDNIHMNYGGSIKSGIPSSCTGMVGKSQKQLDDVMCRLGNLYISMYIYIYILPPPSKTFILCIRYVLECLVFLLILPLFVALHRESILGACGWTHPVHICSCSIAHVKKLAT